MKKEQGKSEKGAKGKKLKGAGSKRENCDRSREHGPPLTEAHLRCAPPPGGYSHKLGSLGQHGYGFYPFLYQRGQGFESLYQRGQGFLVTNVYQRGYGFSKNLCQRGYFCKFSALRASFSVVSNILGFLNWGNLHKRLQCIMFSSSCTTKGMLSQDSCTREGMDFGSKCVLMRVRVSQCRPSGGVQFLAEQPPGVQSLRIFSEPNSEFHQLREFAYFC